MPFAPRVMTVREKARIQVCPPAASLPDKRRAPTRQQLGKQVSGSRGWQRLDCWKKTEGLPSQVCRSCHGASDASVSTQGFPDKFIFHGTIGQQYKQIANAVSPQLTKSLMRSILSAHAANCGLTSSGAGNKLQLVFSNSLQTFAEFVESFDRSSLPKVSRHIPREIKAEEVPKLEPMTYTEVRHRSTCGLRRPPCAGNNRRLAVVDLDVARLLSSTARCRSSWSTTPSSATTTPPATAAELHSRCSMMSRSTTVGTTNQSGAYGRL